MKQSPLILIAASEAINKMYKEGVEPEEIVVKFGKKAIQHLLPKMAGWDRNYFGIPWKFPESPYPLPYYIAIWARKEDVAFCLRLVHIYQILSGKVIYPPSDPVRRCLEFEVELKDYLSVPDRRPQPVYFDLRRAPVDNLIVGPESEIS